MASRFLCTTCNEPTSALALYHAWLVFLDFTPLRLNYLSGRERDRDRERQRETERDIQTETERWAGGGSEYYSRLVKMYDNSNGER